MVVIEDTIEIEKETISESKDADHLERLIEARMHSSLCDKMKKSLQEMSLLDIEQTNEGNFEVKASVVLMTTQDMLTALQRLATTLRDDHDFSDNQVGETLEIFESTKGF